MENIKVDKKFKSEELNEYFTILDENRIIGDELPQLADLIFELDEAFERRLDENVLKILKNIVGILVNHQFQNEEKRYITHAAFLYTMFGIVIRRYKTNPKMKDNIEKLCMYYHFDINPKDAEDIGKIEEIERKIQTRIILEMFNPKSNN